MIVPSLSVWEFIFRAAAVYFFLLIILRLTGRRQVGQLSPFDFVMLLILSNAVQNSMNGGDNSVTGGLILATTLVLINWGLAYLTFKSKRFSNIIDGVPEVLIHNGKVVRKIMRKERLSHDELQAIIRKNGVDRIEDVKIAIIEVNGAISVIKCDSPNVAAEK